MTRKEYVRVTKLSNLIYKSDVDIDYVIKELMNMLKKEEETEVVVENTLGRAYYENKEFPSSIYYYKKALEKKPDNLSSFLGLFKNYVQRKDWQEASRYLQTYKECSLKENKVVDVRVLEIILQNMISSTFQYVPLTSYYFETNLKEDVAYFLYQNLLIQYNMQNYEECLVILKQLEKEGKRVKLDFSIVRVLMEEVLKKDKKQSLDDAYKTLEKAYDEKDYPKMLSSLELICKHPLRKRTLVFHSLYLLANQNYKEQVTCILSSFQLVFKEEEKYIKIIQNTMKNQEAYNNLAKEQYILYWQAMHYGRMECQIGNMKNAYEIFKLAYDETQMPIFLYYTGKMLYKMQNYKEAEKYLLEYVKCGDNKISKAYLYLSSIAYKKHNRKKSVQYANIGNAIGKLYLEDFIIEADCFSDEDDILKLKMQNKKMDERRFQK